VRLLRQRLQLTATELAAEAGLSPGMLSKIENGGTSPSLSTLKALSRALNVPMTSFFADFEERRDCSYVRAGQGVLIERRGTKSGHRYELLGHSLSGDIVVEPYLITLSEDAEPYVLFQHDGVEFLYMLTGKVIYRHADKLYPMSAGDALYFDAGAPHGPEELIERPMTYLSIIIYPRT
jgi:transcriptional regulator with XRE-family HTH domain